MDFRWNLVELKFKKLLAVLLRNKVAINQYNNIIGMYDINGNMNLEDILIFGDIDANDLEPVIDNYSQNCEGIDDLLYNICTNLFPMYAKEYLYNQRYMYKSFDISDCELVNIGYDIINSLGIKSLSNYYDWLVKYRKLNIIDFDDKLVGINERLLGMTLQDIFTKKSYINVYRQHTINDIETLIHEFFHAYFYYIDNNDNDGYKVFMELEGEYGSGIADKYLEDNNFPEAVRLRKERLDLQLIRSLYLIVSYLTINSMNNKKYDISKIQSDLDLNIEPLKINVDENLIHSSLACNAYSTVADMISYLTSLDVLSKYEPKEAIRIIGSIKDHDGINTLENLDYHGISFHKDDLETLFNEYNSIMKKLTK